MSEEGYQIHNVYFEADSMVIGYINLPTDVRVSGQVVVQKQLRMALSHPDYAEDALRLHDRIEKVLRSVLHDFETSEPYTPASEDDEDDDERGMGE